MLGPARDGGLQGLAGVGGGCPPTGSHTTGAAQHYAVRTYTQGPLRTRLLLCTRDRTHLVLPGTLCIANPLVNDKTVDCLTENCVRTQLNFADQLNVWDARHSHALSFAGAIDFRPCYCFTLCHTIELFFAFRVRSPAVHTLDCTETEQKKKTLFFLYVAARAWFCGLELKHKNRNCRIESVSPLELFAR